MTPPRIIYLISLDDQQSLIAGPTPEAALAYRALKTTQPNVWLMAHVKPFHDKSADSTQPLAHLRNGLTRDTVADELMKMIDAINKCKEVYRCAHCEVGITFDSDAPCCHTCATKANITKIIKALEAGTQRAIRHRIWNDALNGFYGWITLNEVMPGGMWIVRWQYSIQTIAVENHSIISGFNQFEAEGHCADMESAIEQDMRYYQNKYGHWSYRRS